MSIIFSVGKYGGFYISMGATLRFTFGWVAVTVIRPEFDVLMHRLRDRLEAYRESSK